MDKTPRYIEMSEKALKIQALWRPQDGDWFAIKRDLTSGRERYALKGEVYQAAYVTGGRIYFVKYNREDSEPEIKAVHLQYLHQRNFKLTWLPTQGQLQGMLEERAREKREYTRSYIADEYLEGFIIKCVLTDFFHWAEKEWTDYSFTRMEQLWLSFYMRELDKRNWDDGRREWVYLTKRERIGYFPLTV